MGWHKEISQEWEEKGGVVGKVSEKLMAATFPNFR